MTGKQTLIVAASLLTLIYAACNKDDEIVVCQWFPATSDSVYTKMSADTVKYTTATTDNSVNFDGIVFESNDCETITVSVNGGPRIPVRRRNVGTMKLFDEPVDNMVYLSWQSDTVKALSINGFTYTTARPTSVLWKHKSGYPNGEIYSWFASNIGILAVYTVYKQHADSPTKYVAYELR